MHSVPGWSYSYFAIFVSVCCLCTCPSVTVWGGLGTSYWWQLAVTYHWLYRVSWFVRLLAAKGSITLPVLSTVEAQLLVHERNFAKAAPEAQEWQETGS